MTWRKLAVLVEHLPPESALSAQMRVARNDLPKETREQLDADQTAEHDFEAEQWSRTDTLLASVRDELHFLRHGYQSAHSKTRLKWTPEPLPRPGVKPKKKKQKLSTTQVNTLWQHLQQQQTEEG